MSEIVKGYKATDKNMQCRGFQYTVGETYQHDGDISLCNSGFHFCQNPLDVLDYYDLCDSNFITVEAEGECISDDKKTVTNSLKVTASIGLPGFIKASIEWIKNSVKDNPCASGDYSQLASSGDYSQLASSGDYSKLASSGDSSQLASSGDYSVIAGIGVSCMAKAKKGCWIVLAEWEYDEKIGKNIPISVVSKKVDGKKIKEDVFYKLIGGKFQEVNK